MGLQERIVHFLKNDVVAYSKEEWEHGTSPFDPKKGTRNFLIGLGVAIGWAVYAKHNAPQTDITLLEAFRDLAPTLVGGSIVALYHQSPCAYLVRKYITPRVYEDQPRTHRKMRENCPDWYQQIKNVDPGRYDRLEEKLDSTWRDFP